MDIFGGRCGGDWSGRGSRGDQTTGLDFEFFVHRRFCSELPAVSLLNGIGFWSNGVVELLRLVVAWFS